MKTIMSRCILPFFILILIVVIWFVIKLFFALIAFFTLFSELFLDLIIFLYRVFGG